MGNNYIQSGIEKYFRIIYALFSIKCYTNEINSDFRIRFNVRTIKQKFINNSFNGMFGQTLVLRANVNLDILIIDIDK